MSRPLRIQFAGALYHLTSRGDGREAIYLDDSDRELFLSVLAQVCNHFNWVCHSYCLMTNHYHLLIETPDGNLSQGMRQLNGVYTQNFNRSKNRVGHVFQGRYKAILVDKESYLLELTRYIVLNPVRAAMVRSAKDWRWSSYRSTTGLTSRPEWLNTDWILSNFSRKKSDAITGYRNFIAAGKGQPSPLDDLKNQIFLGDDDFVEEMQCLIDEKISLDEIPSSQKKQRLKILENYQKHATSRNEAIINAYQSGGYSMVEIANHFGLHYSSISKIIKFSGSSQFKT